MDEVSVPQKWSQSTLVATCWMAALNEWSPPPAIVLRGIRVKMETRLQNNVKHLDWQLSSAQDSAVGWDLVTDAPYDITSVILLLRMWWKVANHCFNSLALLKHVIMIKVMWDLHHLLSYQPSFWGDIINWRLFSFASLMTLWFVHLCPCVDS